MNREILFKGKRVDNGEWVEGFYCPRPYSHFPCEPSIFPIDTIDKEWYGIEVILETVGQFTGLTDKNGVKIFEGDIIKYKENLFEIKYSTEQARYLAVLTNGVFDPVAMQNCEVVGNVFDNSELLKGEENE